ncbi:MAG: TonB-dependent receptor [Acidobacteriota bacterium]
MRWMKAWLGVLAVVLLSAGPASGQATTGTITGRALDGQGQPLPGVTVTATSPNLQGTRTATTGTQGDYIFAVLPPGTYTVSFELPGFDRQKRSVALAPTQVYPLDIAMGLPSLDVVVNVVGAASVLVQTAQVATNLSQVLIAALPTNRDINAALLLAPSVHATGPGGSYSISGGMTFENRFLLNGVTINENLRGQPYDLYIEDAIQETTVASAGISAEFGHFGGGVVNVITKSGGDRFSGSLRDTLNNDSWRALTPYAADQKAADLLSTYEYTLGGPILHNRLWFFTAGRLQNTTEGRTLATTNGSYDFGRVLRRYEGKATYSTNSRARLEGSYMMSTEQQTNAAQDITLAMDRSSLFDTTRDLDLFTINYFGILTPRLAVEARYSVRNDTIKDFGGRSTDQVNGTLLLDGTTGRRYWAPTFCGVCDPEERDNQTLFLKGSYFRSTAGAGSHNTVFGYDGFNDRRFANNHQSGSDYRIYGSSTIVTGETVTPVFISGPTTVIQWNPIRVESLGTKFRTHGAFFSDSWRISSRLTANLGLRFDKNDGVNSAGDVVSRDSAWSPRLGVVWDPTGGERWSVSGSIGRYVSALANTIANTGSAGGNSDNYLYVYEGPSINASKVVEVPTAAAVGQVFDWFNTHGGTSRPLSSGSYPISLVAVGTTPVIRDSLTSPNALEYAGGISRRLGERATVRADLIYRSFHDFYAWRTDQTTGSVTDSLGQTLDLTLVENTDRLKRRYAGLSTQGTYRAAARLNLGATYTLSRTWGNFDGETANGPAPDAGLQYPEYKQAAWNYPEGDLSIDQRHRARVWATYGVPRISGLLVSVLQTLETGVPYGAVAMSRLNPQLYVTNPGYVSPPTAVTYYLTPRDAFRTEGQRRIDLAANYAHKLSQRGGVELFGQFQVLNLFNQSQLCGCGQAVFQNGGAVNRAQIDQTARILQSFNPFTTVPVEGVNWTREPNFGKAVSRLSYTPPRAFRASFGVRF